VQVVEDGDGDQLGSSGVGVKGLDDLAVAGERRCNKLSVCGTTSP
jgi:hypothetical protein